MGQKLNIPFLAGSRLGAGDAKNINKVVGQVFLLVASIDKDEALDMTKSLLNNPELIVELINTLQPWPTDIVEIDIGKLNGFQNIKTIFPPTN